MLISGDGLFNEVLNALVSRSLPAGLLPSSVEFHSELKKSLHLLPLALLPGGTSNGLATSLFGHIDAVDMLRRIMNSPPRSVDVMSVQTPIEGAEDDPCASEFTRAAARDKRTAPRVRVDMLTFLYAQAADFGQEQIDKLIRLHLPL